MALYYIGDVAYDGNYLEHHGIKGMKWYVRRFQNPDGTWTEAGKKRYGNPRSGTRHAQADAKAYRKIAEKEQKIAKNQEDFVRTSYEQAGKAMEDAYQALLKGKDTNSKNLVGLAKHFVENGDMIKENAAERVKKAEEYLRYADFLDKPVDYVYKINLVGGDKMADEPTRPKTAKDDDEPDVRPSAQRFVQEVDEYFNRAENKERWRKDSEANRQKMNEARRRYADEVMKDNDDFDSQDFFFTEDGGSTAGRKSLNPHDQQMLKSIVEAASARSSAASAARNNAKTRKEKRAAPEQYSKNVDKYFADLFGETADYVEKMPKEMRDAAYAYVYEMWGFNY